MTARKPAVKDVEKPAKAKTEPKEVKKVEGITIHDLAEQLGYKSEKALRARIRRVSGGGAQVGKGKKYTWKNKQDPAYTDLVAKLQGEKKN